MTRKIPLLLLSIALASCGKSSAPEVAPAASADAPAAANVTADAAAGSGDVCSLIDDPDTLFGQPVTASASSLPTAPKACEWKNAEGRLCGLVMPFGADWNPVPNLKLNYDAMATSMKAFGEVNPVAGIGEEAVAVDGKIMGAQMAIRTSKAIANIGAACGGSGPGNLEHAEKIARAIAPRL
jgi:hypothetical protein